MDFSNMNAEQLEERAAQIADELNQDGADLEALEAEITAIEQRKADLKAEADERRAAMDAVINGAGDEIEQRKENNKMNLTELRASKEYVNAYAKYMKTEDPKECRALLTDLVDDGTVPVPVIAEQRIRTAWDRENIMSRVGRLNVKGSVKIGFEISGSAAVIHVEGEDAPAEETLTLGIVELKPQSIKKWITISDELYDLTGEEFVDYIYDELGYKIAKKAADTLIALIAALPAASTATAPAAAQLTAGVAPDTIVTAEGLLSDEATRPVVIMNKQTAAAFRGLTTQDGYLINDPFDGMEVLYNNSLPVYSAATSGQVYAIVGDLENGARANFPNGDEIKYKFDDLSLAESDLIKIVGRMFVGLGVVAPLHFVNIKKA